MLFRKLLTILLFVCSNQLSIGLAKDTNITINEIYPNCIIDVNTKILNISLTNTVISKNTSCNALVGFSPRTSSYIFTVDGMGGILTTLSGTATVSRAQSNLVTLWLGTVVSGYLNGSSFVYEFVSAIPDPTQCMTETGVQQVKSNTLGIALFNLPILLLQQLISLFQLDTLSSIVNFLSGSRLAFCTGNGTTDFMPGLTNS